MNNRVFSIVVVVTLVSLSSGCSGMKNFLFGRGARCGMCNANTGGVPNPQFGNTMQAPCGCPPASQPHYAPDYGYAPQPTQAPYTGGGYSCGSCGSQYSNDCGCGYGYADPYASGGAVGISPGGQSVAPIQGDDFSARRFDSDGSRIIWEEPYANGTSL